MIEQIHLQNFQAHSDLLIELDERVTSIVGPSDVGKSSVIRALRWAALNIPVGCMIKDGTKQASVELIADGRRIVRTRGSENAYSLDGKEFRAFRSDVPQDISALLNLSEINFQGQHDPLYWFSSTAGDVSRQLNAVVNLEIIDRTLQAATKEVNRSKQLVEMAEENLTRSVEERDGLKWVVDADGDFKKVEGLADKQDCLREQLEYLAILVKCVIETAYNADSTKSLANDSDHLLGRMQEAGKAAKRAAELLELLKNAQLTEAEKLVEIPDIQRLDVAAEAVSTSRGQGRAMRLLELIQAARVAASDRKEGVPDLAALDTMVDLLKTRRDRVRQLKVLLDETVAADEDRQEATQLAAKAHEELEEKTEGICPVCGKEMN